jgi:hypothetical protein
MRYLKDHFRFILVYLMQNSILIKKRHVSYQKQNIGFGIINVWFKYYFKILPLLIFVFHWRGNYNGAHLIMVVSKVLTNHFNFVKKFELFIMQWKAWVNWGLLSLKWKLIVIWWIYVSHFLFNHLHLFFVFISNRLAGRNIRVKNDIKRTQKQLVFHPVFFLF